MGRREKEEREKKKYKDKYTHRAKEWMPISIQDDLFYCGPGNILRTTRNFLIFFLTFIRV